MFAAIPQRPGVCSGDDADYKSFGRSRSGSKRVLGVDHAHEFVRTLIHEVDAPVGEDPVNIIYYGLDALKIKILCRLDSDQKD